MGTRQKQKKGKETKWCKKKALTEATRGEIEAQENVDEKYSTIILEKERDSEGDVKEQKEERGKIKRRRGINKNNDRKEGEGGRKGE